ncbi:ABC transporter permease, partial [Treponema sp.]|uniref:ABC transporter permease n=1 Tax=Treponema sp. TaxID=166 RepID=UPI00388EC9D1
DQIGWSFLSDKETAGKMISTVMVKVKDGYDIDNIAGQIQRKVKKTQAVKTKAMTSGIASSLSSFSKITGLLMIVVWILCLIILAVVSTLITGERKKEFAVLRVMGASKKKLSRLVTAESVLVNAAGSLSGIIIAVLCILPFHSLIKEAIGLPFLLPDFFKTLVLLILSLLLSVIFGCLTSSYSAHKISKIDTGIILREGN